MMKRTGCRRYHVAWIVGDGDTHGGGETGQVASGNHRAGLIGMRIGTGGTLVLMVMVLMGAARVRIRQEHCHDPRRNALRAPGEIPPPRHARGHEARRHRDTQDKRQAKTKLEDTRNRRHVVCRVRFRKASQSAL